MVLHADTVKNKYIALLKTHLDHRWLFRFVLKIFYGMYLLLLSLKAANVVLGTIVVENAHLIPQNGTPCIVCANHSNSLTDAL